MASEPTKYEPSAASIEKMLRAAAEVQGYDFDEIPIGKIEEARCVAPIAIKAAVAADPLLCAAAEMRGALIELKEAIEDVRSAVGFSESVEANQRYQAAMASADAALAKAKGE